jgi:ADP-ribose pyrophosphatase YjhB (NUDIX family)
MRIAFRVGYWLLRVEAPLLRRPGHGVKCLLTRDGEVLLVRHTYGPRRVWRVPGGRSRRGEEGSAAAAREMHEELGLEDLAWRELATLELRLDGRRVTVECLHADVGQRPLRLDAAEIAEARYFPVGELPERLGAEEMRVLGMLSLPFSAASGETSQ